MDSAKLSTGTEPQVGFADVNGTRLYYEVTGAGRPLVFINGHTLDRRMWDAQMPVFAAKYRTIRYDKRGYGKSALPNVESYAHHEDLYALLSFLGVKQAHIVGLSLGGSIAINFALSYPDAVSSIALVDTAGLGGFMWPDQLKAWFEPINAAGKSGDIARAKRLWIETDWFVPARESAEVAAHLDTILADYSGWHFANDNPVRNLTPPPNDRLGDIKAPALVIVGERDLTYYNHPLADRLVETIPDARKVIIEGAGHMANMEDPGRFNAVLAEFLDAQ